MDKSDEVDIGGTYAGVTCGAPPADSPLSESRSMNSISSILTMISGMMSSALSSDGEGVRRGVAAKSDIAVVHRSGLGCRCGLVMVGDDEIFGE